MREAAAKSLQKARTDASLRFGQPRLDGRAVTAVVGGGELARHLALFDEALVAALHTVEMLVRSPESLAYLLEAAGAIALERAGAILDQRVTGPEG